MAEPDVPQAAASARAPLPLPRGFPERFPVRDDGRRPRRYRAVALMLRIALRGLLGRRLVIEGTAGVPDGGPLYIAANHLSNVDPMLLGAFTPGTNFAMAKRELYVNRLMSWIWAGCNTFPVDRGAADRRSLRTALDIVGRGGRLILWVEGTRAVSPGMRRAEPGIGFLLRRAPAPVVPVAVWGSEAVLAKGRRLPRRAAIHVRYGDAFTPDTSGRDNQAIADQVGRRIAEMLPAEYRGAYGTAPGGPLSSTG